jgi:hypothetical protein
MSDSQMSRTQIPRESRNDPVYLVVGDWFVDEHWVCGVHRSSSSSRTGRSHLRALHSANSTVHAFCGAGRSAQFLHQLYQGANLVEPLISLIGLGFWHWADTSVLKSFFDLNRPTRNPYRLTLPEQAPKCEQPKGIELINMNDALNLNAGKLDNNAMRDRDAKEYTTRVIRIYTHGEDQVDYERVDWEGRAVAPVKWKEPNRRRLFELLEEQREDRPIRAVLIKDMKKGVVTDELINWLVSLESCKRVPWFVSTKRWWPSWLKNLGKQVDLQLVIVPEVPAREAILNKDPGLTRWLTRSGRVSKEALALMTEFAESIRAKNIFVLPDGFSAMACRCNDDGVTSVVVQSKCDAAKVPVDMGYASILFPTLVTCLTRPSVQHIDETLMELSLGAAHEWVDFEAKRVLEPEIWPEGQPAPWKGKALSCLKTFVHTETLGEPPKFGTIKTHDWKTEEEEWKQALKKVGIVTNKDGTRSLELWRAMVEIDGYVCCEESARRELRVLLHGVQSFAKQPRHHASCMLVAAPGSGKTFLAKRLADTAGLRFLPFNITQMRSKADILECLDNIVAAQAEKIGRPLMVFIDEINAKLENAPVYGAFLTPLEDGTYVRSGRTFHIKPCMWVFAGTRHPQTDRSVSYDPYRGLVNDGPEKGSDFVSRLTLEVLNLIHPGGTDTVNQDIADEEFRATEKVYLGACMLRSEFPDVRRVSEAVLRAFRELPTGTTVREIKHFVRRFSDIQYGEVTARSIPIRWPNDDDGHFRARWESKHYPDEADVRILTAVEADRDSRTRSLSKVAATYR